MSATLIHVADYHDGGPAICGSRSRHTTIDTAYMSCETCAQLMRERYPDLARFLIANPR